ncbi:hypothetical protein COO60DRAFT_1474849 [Scenedesmus sp. NREL 46B-D3]|nr:hypothetical protein COO60DRAFT_1474849 [Scenedesmus sp. NREL 46B-D3]
MADLNTSDMLLLLLLLSSPAAASAAAPSTSTAGAAAAALSASAPSAGRPILLSCQSVPSLLSRLSLLSSLYSCLSPPALASPRLLLLLSSLRCDRSL